MPFKNTQKFNCLNCDKYVISHDNPEKRLRKYCSQRCAAVHQYKIKPNLKNTITINARKVSHDKMKKEGNWLNSKKSRDKLKQIMNTNEYKLKARNAKLGDKNPMYGKRNKESPNYKGGKCIDRGFNWKKIKLQIKERDGFRCVKCGVHESELKQNLQVHHICPYKCTQDNSFDNLITLCSKCHANTEWVFLKIKDIKIEPFQGIVYNFAVEEHESYIADDLVVHNCACRVLYVQKKK